MKKVESSGNWMVVALFWMRTGKFWVQEMAVKESSR